MYSSSFFKSIETGGNVSRALVSSCKVQGGGGGGLLVSLVCCTRFTLYNILCYHIFSTVIQCRKCYDFYKENFDGAIICHFLSFFGLEHGHGMAEFCLSIINFDGTI